MTDWTFDETTEELSIGEMVMIKNNLTRNGEVGIIVEKLYEGDYIDDIEYKVCVKNQVHWFKAYEVERAE